MNELYSLVDVQDAPSGTSPACTDPLFDPGWYWSSTTYSSGIAYTLYFDGAQVYPEDEAGGDGAGDVTAVRCVHDGTGVCSAGNPNCSCSGVTAWCTDPASCTDSCGYTGAQATSCYNVQCDGQTGLDTCGNLDTHCTCVDASATCVNTASCEDSCLNTGSKAVSCFGAQCNPTGHHQDTCGQTDNACPCVATRCYNETYCTDDCGEFDYYWCGGDCNPNTPGWDTCGHRQPSCY
jgi:hypothetical protein